MVFLIFPLSSTLHRRLIRCLINGKFNSLSVSRYRVITLPFEAIRNSSILVALIEVLVLLGKFNWALCFCESWIVDVYKSCSLIPGISSLIQDQTHIDSLRA